MRRFNILTRLLGLLFCLSAMPASAVDLTVHNGATSQLISFFVQDSSQTVIKGLTGLAWNTSGLTAYYLRDIDNASVQITLATATLGTWATGGFIVADGTNMPGVYQLGIPNAALNGTGEKQCWIYLQGAANMSPRILTIAVTATDAQDGVHGGMSSLPNVASGSAGAIPTTGTGSNQISLSNGNITIGAYASMEDPATLVLGATGTSWNTAGTVGNEIHSAGSAGDPWATAYGTYAVGTFGWLVNNLLITSGTVQGTPSSTSFTLAAGSSSTANAYVNDYAYFPAYDEYAMVSAYNTSTKACTTAGYSRSVTPAANSVYYFPQPVWLNGNEHFVVGSQDVVNGLNVATPGSPTALSPYANINAINSNVANTEAALLPSGGGLSVVDGSSSTTVIDSGLTAASTTAFKGQVVVFTSGADVGQTAIVQSNTSGASSKLTVISAFSAAPASGDTFSLVTGVGQRVVDLLANSLGSDNKILLSNNAQTGVTIPTVTTLTNPTGDTAGTTTLLGQVASNLPNLAAMQAGLPTDSSVATDVQTGLTAQGYTSARAAYLIPSDTMTVTTGTAQSATPNTITLASAASATNNVYQGEVVYIVSGTGAGEINTVQWGGYTGATRVAKMGLTWPITPDNTSVYKIFAVLVQANAGLVH